jgi:hypothetical protein
MRQRDPRVPGPFRCPNLRIDPGAHSSLDRLHTFVFPANPGLTASRLPVAALIRKDLISNQVLLTSSGRGPLRALAPF